MGAVRLTGEQGALDTDAEFQSWVNNLSAALTTAGLPKTTDTGQVTLPCTNTRAQNPYEIRRLNDAHNGTHPILFKIAYGPTVATTRPAPNISVGTGSDGAGNLTGAILTGAIIAGGLGASGSELADWFVSVGEGHLHIYYASDTAKSGYTNNSCMYFFERAMDEVGGLHPEDGAHIMYSPANGWEKRIYAHTFGITGTAGSASNSQGFFSRQPAEAADDAYSNEVGIFPQPWMIRAKVRWHRHALARNGRVPYGTQIDAAHLGATRKFMGIDTGFTAQWASSQSGLNIGLLLPWY